MNNSLIFKGLQNDDEETIRKVKSAFIAELELSVDKVSQIFDNPPTVIIEGVEDSKLERFKKVLEEAGAVIELKGNKPSCLAHWLEDEDFEEEETLNSGNETIEFDNSPIEIDESIFKYDYSSNKNEEIAKTDTSELTLDNEPDTDLSIDFADDNGTLSSDTDSLAFDTLSSDDSSTIIRDVSIEEKEEPELDFSIKMEEPPVKEEPAISVTTETVQEPPRVTPPTPPQESVQEATAEDIEVPKVHYKKKAQAKMPWDVIIIATVGVILLGIANWFYFRG